MCRYFQVMIFSVFGYVNVVFFFFNLHSMFFLIAGRSFCSVGVCAYKLLTRVPPCTSGLCSPDACYFLMQGAVYTKLY